MNLFKPLNVVGQMYCCNLKILHKNAMPLLNRYRDELCCFVDDIQGTAAVTLGSLIAASRAAGRQLKRSNCRFLSAGSAGCGIAEQILHK